MVKRGPNRRASRKVRQQAAGQRNVSLRLPSHTQHSITQRSAAQHSTAQHSTPLLRFLTRSARGTYSSVSRCCRPRMTFVPGVSTTFTCAKHCTSSQGSTQTYKVVAGEQQPLCGCQRQCCIAPLGRQPARKQSAMSLIGQAPPPFSSSLAGKVCIPKAVAQHGARHRETQIHSQPPHLLQQLSGQVACEHAIPVLHIDRGKKESAEGRLRSLEAACGHARMDSGRQPACQLACLLQGRALAPGCGALPCRPVLPSHMNTHLG